MKRKAHHVYPRRDLLAWRARPRDEPPPIERCTKCGVETTYGLVGTAGGRRWRRPGGAWTSKKIDCDGGDSLVVVLTDKGRAMADEQAALRDRFAMVALNGLLSRGDMDFEDSPREAYEIADRMLAARGLRR